MFRKPVRTYERKKGGSHWLSASGASTIVREDVPPETKAHPPNEPVIDSDDDSLDYDPFDTTFDRIAKNQIAHPIPQDQYSTSSYSDSSSEATLNKSALEEDDSLLDSPFMNPGLGVMEKKSKNKKQKIDDEKRTITKKTLTRGGKRGGARKNSKFMDENAVPNIEDASDVKSGAGKKKTVRKKKAATEDQLAEEMNMISNGKSIKRKSQENYRALKRCSVRLKRLKISLDKSPASKNRESSVAERSNDSERASGTGNNDDRSANYAEFGEESTILEPPNIDEKKKIEFLKNPVVSLSRLKIPPKRLSLPHFSSSTPVGSKITKIKSSLRLSPIKSNVGEDFATTSDTLSADLPPESIVRAPEANEQKMKPSKKSSTEYLSITPDPEPSGLLFDETEIPNEKSASPVVEKSLEKIAASDRSPAKEFRGESSDLESLFRAYNDDGELSTKSHSQRIETMEFPSRTSPLSDGNYIQSMHNNTNDPFMGFTEVHKDISKKQNSSDKSSNTDEAWSTISESGNVTCDKSISQAGNIERLSSGENTSSEEIENFVDASDIPDKRISLIDKEFFVDVDESKRAGRDDSITVAEENTKDMNLQEEQVLQPVVILSRLTIGKADDYETLNNIRSISSTIETTSGSNTNDDTIIDSPPGRSTDIDELAPIESEFFNDTEESNVEMESLRVDDSKSFTDIENSPMRKESEKDSSGISLINAELSLRDHDNCEISSSENIEKEKIDESSKNIENLNAPESNEEEIAGEKSPMTKICQNNSYRGNDRSSFIQPIVLLTRLNDPVRITRRRNKYRDWDLKLTAIAEKTIDKVSSIVEEDPTIEEIANTPRIEDTEETTSVEEMDGINEKSRVSEQIVLTQRSNDSRESSLTTSQFNESIRGDKVVYLKPGKSWARSLSILSQVHSREDLESLAVGKGRKWRESVHNLLEMQQQGLIQSCVRKNENSKESTLFSGLRNSTAWVPGSSQPDTSRLLGLTSPGRFIRRISIRVVPDSKGFDNVKDTSFLEAYGITPTTENQQTIAQRHTLIAPRKTLDIVSNVLSKEKSRQVVLAQCGQRKSLPFDECYPESFLANCRKIGEGVYGEVFLHEKGSERSVIKIIPIEGEMKINSERQKKFDEILSEIVIAKALHNLRFAEKSATDSFVEVKNIRCVMGKYPKTLIDHWKAFDEEKNSENDCPSIFEEDQLYIVLELGHGGEDLEAYVFQNANEAHALFMQTVLALAVAEETLEFEHRDLHWGNLLISKTNETQIDYTLKGKPMSVASKGVKVSVIDFTLSRMAYQGCSIFNDLSMDDDLFAAQGEYQFDIYRLMRNKLENNWQKFDPFTNILWLHYILDKMITAVRYRKKNTKIHKNAISKLQELKNVILDYQSAVDFVTNCDKATRLQGSRSSISTVATSI